MTARIMSGKPPAKRDELASAGYGRSAETGVYVGYMRISSTARARIVSALSFSDGF